MWFFPKLYLSYVRDRACYTTEALQRGQPAWEFPTLVLGNQSPKLQ